MSDDQKLFPWKDGLPTAPDVELVCKTWPDLKVGDRIEYKAIADLLKIAVKSARFRTVTGAWRRRKQEDGFTLECETGAAFYVASASQTVAATVGVITGIRRKAKHHRLKLAISKPVSDEERGTVEHQARLMINIEQNAKVQRMNILPSTVPAEQPKIAPPKLKEGP